jgi:ADP-ribose pyrophosphatase
MRTILPPKAHLIPENAEIAFKGVVYDTYHWEQELFDGSTATFEMLKRPDTLKVLGINDHQLVILLEEHPSTNKEFYGLPGGRHDVESETELEGAQREMLEETGLTFANWRLLDIFQPQTDIEHFVYIFLATDFESQVAQNLDAGEKIQIKQFDLADIREMAADGRARHLPMNLLKQVESIDQLADLPQYGA